VPEEVFMVGSNQGDGYVEIVHRGLVVVLRGGSVEGTTVVSSFGTVRIVVAVIVVVGIARIGGRWTGRGSLCGRCHLVSSTTLFVSSSERSMRWRLHMVVVVVVVVVAVGLRRILSTIVPLVSFVLSSRRSIVIIIPASIIIIVITTRTSSSSSVVSSIVVSSSSSFVVMRIVVVVVVVIRMITTTLVVVPSTPLLITGAVVPLPLLPRLLLSLRRAVPGFAVHAARIAGRFRRSSILFFVLRVVILFFGALRRGQAVQSQAR